MRRRGAVLVCLLAGLVAGAPRAVGAVEVQDMLGRRLHVAERPTRVVSLAPSLTEIVYALGAESQLVGVTQFCDFPAAAAAKPKVGGIYTPSFEAIAALRPELVLATTEGNLEEHVRTLDRLGLQVYVVRPASFETVLDSVARLGRVLGRGREAERLAGDMRGEVDKVVRALAGLRRPRVLYVVWGNPLIVPGRDALITDLIARAGGESVSAGEPHDYPRLSVEEALARRPEHIVLAQQGDASLDRRLAEWQHLRLLPAVREGRVHQVHGDLLHRPGPRIVEGLRALARMFHPEIRW